ncbi:MAG: fumarylacetoacetase [Cyclobacteriaceae bacterium]|nr:fumarylacetoacetase [Cyclobacteriaceae bacterium]
MESWVQVDANSDFSIYNIPFGIFKQNGRVRAGSAIGNYVIDLDQLHKRNYLDSFELPEGFFESDTLNEFINQGKEVTNALRVKIIELFSKESGELQDNKSDIESILIPMSEVEMLMPVDVPNYTDFYSSIEHATNVGTMFRDPDNALFPNWKHLPVGYHGRSSSIVVSGTPIKRPKGQTKAPDADNPTFGPTQRLDFELEMAFIVGKETILGESVSTKDTEDYIFGFVLFNDWSARDIQVWEYVPLGPFLAKNFGSSVSPWIVTLEALEQFRVETPKQDPQVLPYLQIEGKKNFDINLQVGIIPENSEEQIVSNSNFKYMYWNVNQQLAHHTVNGCNIEIGDMYASGTISGPTEDSYGSMLELAWKGTKPIKMKDGSERKFINDGDTVVMRGYAEKEGMRVGFGEVRSLILPSD